MGTSIIFSFKIKYRNTLLYIFIKKAVSFLRQLSYDLKSITRI